MTGARFCRRDQSLWRGLAKIQCLRPYSAGHEVLGVAACNDDQAARAADDPRSCAGDRRTPRKDTTVPVWPKARRAGWATDPKGLTIRRAEAAIRVAAVCSLRQTEVVYASVCNSDFTRELCRLMEAAAMRNALTTAVQIDFLYLYSARIARACCAAVRRS